MPNPNEPMLSYTARLAKDFGSDAPDIQAPDCDLERVIKLQIKGYRDEIAALRNTKLANVSPEDVLFAVRAMNDGQRRELMELLGIPQRSPIVWTVDKDGNPLSPSLHSKL